MRKSIVIATLASTVGGLGLGAILTSPSFATASPAAVTDTTVATSTVSSPGAATKSADAAAKHDKGHGGRDGHGRGAGVEGGQNAVAAKILGMTDAELSTALKGGKTLAQLAADKGVAVNTLVTAMVDDVKAKVAAALTAGTITQAKADEELAEEPTETTDKVNAVQPQRGMGGHGKGQDSNKVGKTVTPKTVTPTTAATATS